MTNTATLGSVAPLPRPRPEWMPLHLRHRLILVIGLAKLVQTVPQTLVRLAPVVVALPPTWKLMPAWRPLPPPCKRPPAWRPLPPPRRPQRRPIGKVLKMPCATKLNMNVVVRVFAQFRY